MLTTSVPGFGCKIADKGRPVGRLHLLDARLAARPLGDRHGPCRRPEEDRRGCTNKDEQEGMKDRDDWMPWVEMILACSKNVKRGLSNSGALAAPNTSSRPNRRIYKSTMRPKVHCC